MIDECIKRQLEKDMDFFLKYFPVRIRNVGNDAVKARELIWAFKDGKEEAQEQVAQMTAAYLKEKHGRHMETNEVVLVCVPASTQEQNEKRYEWFCGRVSELCGVKNGFPYLRVVGDRLAVHEHRHGNERTKTIDKVQIIEFDDDYFFGKDVVVMDDVVTTGTSYALFAAQLENCHANVLGGVFLARTHYRYGK